MVVSIPITLSEWSFFTLILYTNCVAVLQLFCASQLHCLRIVSDITHRAVHHAITLTRFVSDPEGAECVRGIAEYVYGIIECMN